MWSASASHSMIASQKKPAPAKAIVSPLCSRNSMKIAAAISALVSAIVSARAVLKAPSGW